MDRVAMGAGPGMDMPIMHDSDRYDLVRDIGSGNFGVARLLRDKHTRDLVAVKYIERGDRIDENVQREIINHRSLRHPNIVRFKEVILTPTHLAILMEYASGGELFDRKSLEGKERLLYEKKLKIREALEEGKPIPTELRNEEAALRQEIDLEDEQTAVPHSTIDDEYANATDRDPKILLTTSRNPSAPLTQFVKELKIVFPNSQRMNRGGQVISEIIETCRAHDFTDVILVHEHRGVPDGIIISHLPFGPTAYFGLLNVVTRHDIKDKKVMGTMPEAYPHLILENFSTKLGQRTANILKYLFPVPKPDTKRIITFANQSDYISFRHHIYEKKGGPKSVELKEIGPRFELRLYQVKLGTMDQDEAQTEWVIRPYMNTSKKRKFLGD